MLISIIKKKDANMKEVEDFLDTPNVYYKYVVGTTTFIENLLYYIVHKRVVKIKFKGKT